MKYDGMVEKKSREYDYSGIDGYDSVRYRRGDDRKAEEILAPLTSRLSGYDDLRLQLEEKGGSLHMLERMTAILNEPMHIKSYWGDSKATLSDQKSLREALRDVSYDIHLDIRRLDHGLPVYYLFRQDSDYWSEYSLIVEDLYLSPGFPMTDERFVKYMHMGHEEYALRLSQFRQAAGAISGGGESGDSYKIDKILYKLGRHVFQAAWHDDQRPGFLTARHFGLDHFKQAIELLYLCLSGELCELRGAVDDAMIRFFQTGYPHPAIEQFLGKLVQLDGSEINDIPQHTLSLYGKLSQAFSQFLKTEVVWGSRSLSIPLYKLIFANLNRLHWVAEKLQSNQDLAEAKKRLEKTAEGIVGGILKME